MAAIGFIRKINDFLLVNGHLTHLGEHHGSEPNIHFDRRTPKTVAERYLDAQELLI